MINKGGKMIDITRLFAKTHPFVSLFDHCCSVGLLAGKLWDLKVIDRAIIRREHLCLLAALHDLGKCDPSFQRKAEKGLLPYIDELTEQGYLHTTAKQYRHEWGTEQILLRFILKNENENKEALAKILRLHHQKSGSAYNSGRYTPSPKKAEWENAQIKLVEALQDFFAVKVDEITFLSDDASCSMLWGIVILADWLSSGGLDDKVEQIFAQTPLKPKPIQEMFALSSLRPLQQECEKLASQFPYSPPQAIIIEAPMGEGKTEAAIYLASKLIATNDKKGFYIALPTMATARQMEGRTSAVLKKNGLDPALLVHSTAWLDKEIESHDEVDKSWFAPTKRALLSNYAVGTVDQAMMAVLKIRQGILRLLGLSSKVLIIDEMHAYDAYMQQIIYRLLSWCKVLNIPVIILSATLPTDVRKKIAQAFDCEEFAQFSQNYPLITAFNKDNTIKEIAVSHSYISKNIALKCLEYDSYDTIAHLALLAIENGGCACVIMNTVSDAQEVYLKAKELATPDIELKLFHSRFLAKDRASIEEYCLQAFGKGSSNRPAKALLIATQVVEQSLDLDFDCMLSALAPIDLLLQRSGRLHRHERQRPASLSTPIFSVLINKQDPEHKRISLIYHSWILKQTQDALAGLSTINIPADIRPLIEKVYTHNQVQQAKGLEKDWIKYIAMEEVFQAEANQHIFPLPSHTYFFPTEGGDFFEENDSALISSDAHTRISGNTYKISILPKSKWDKELLAKPSLEYARQVLEYSVSIFSKQEPCINDKQIKCGGYLKGIYAVQGEGDFTLYFKSYGEDNAKKYTISPEYGVKEEQ